MNLSPPDRLLARIAGCEGSLREAMERGLCRSATYLRYRNAAVLDLLRFIATAIDDNDLNCMVTGGLAYDALRGQLTRVHHDLDLVCLAGDRSSVMEAFKGIGISFKERSPYHALARTDGGLQVDMFSWRKTAEQAVENIIGGVLVRFPRVFFTARQTASLNGVSLTLPGNDYFKCIRPFVDLPADRRFLDELTTDSTVVYDQRTELVVRRIALAVHEFSIIS